MKVFRRYKSVVSGVSVLVAAMSLAGADSQTAIPSTEGFYYSEYLQTGGILPEEQIFTVSSAQKPLLADGRQILSRTFEAANQLPLAGYLAEEYINDGKSAFVGTEFDLSLAGWDLATDALYDSILAATDNPRTGKHSIRHFEVDIRTRSGHNYAHIGMNIVGALRESPEGAMAWQLRGFTGLKVDEHGGGIGLIFRQVLGGELAGLNTFLDYETSGSGEFWRWSGGGEIRSSFIDLYGNYYTPLSDELELRSGTQRMYSARGYDAGINLRLPKVHWWSVVGGYYLWEGKYGEKDDDNSYAGLRVTPPGTPLVAEAHYRQKGDDRFVGHVSYIFDFGPSQSGEAGRTKFEPQNYLFSPGQREYTQRIYHHDVEL